MIMKSWAYVYLNICIHSNIEITVTPLHLGSNSANKSSLSRNVCSLRKTMFANFFKVRTNDYFSSMLLAFKSHFTHFCYIHYISSEPTDNIFK